MHFLLPVAVFRMTPSWVDLAKIWDQAICTTFKIECCLDCSSCEWLLAVDMQRRRYRVLLAEKPWFLFEINNSRDSQRKYTDLCFCLIHSSQCCLFGVMLFGRGTSGGRVLWYMVPLWELLSLQSGLQSGAQRTPRPRISIVQFVLRVEDTGKQISSLWTMFLLQYTGTFWLFWQPVFTLSDTLSFCISSCSYALSYGVYDCVVFSRLHIVSIQVISCHCFVLNPAVIVGVSTQLLRRILRALLLSSVVLTTFWYATLFFYVPKWPWI